MDARPAPRSFIVTAFVALTVALAGCAESGKVTDAASGSMEGPGEGAATIVGQVLDEEVLPVAGATIELDGYVVLETVTGSAGDFTFRDLEPGSYRLTAQKVGFEVLTRTVTVGAGEIQQVSLVLDPVPVSVARYTTEVADGYMELGVYAAGFFFPFNVTGTPSRTGLVSELAGDAVSAVAAMEWQSSTPVTAQWMYLAFWFMSENLNRTEGRSPLLTRTDELAKETQGSSNWRMTTAWGLSGCRIDPAACAAQPASFAQAAVQQKSTVYVAIFYVDHAPPNFSPLPA